jgi:hypothetical protein
MGTTHDLSTAFDLKFASRTRRLRFASCRSAVLEAYDFSVSVQRFLPRTRSNTDETF